MVRILSPLHLYLQFLLKVLLQRLYSSFFFLGIILLPLHLSISSLASSTSFASAFSLLGSYSILPSIWLLPPDICPLVTILLFRPHHPWRLCVYSMISSFLSGTLFPLWHLLSSLISSFISGIFFSVGHLLSSMSLYFFPVIFFPHWNLLSSCAPSFLPDIFYPPWHILSSLAPCFFHDVFFRSCYLLSSLVSSFFPGIFLIPSGIFFFLPGIFHLPPRYRICCWSHVYIYSCVVVYSRRVLSPSIELRSSLINRKPNVSSQKRRAWQEIG